MGEVTSVNQGGERKWNLGGL